MKFLSFCAAVAISISAPGLAVPANPADTSQKHLGPVQIPFDPPLDLPLRYRWEKSVQKDGATAMTWSVDDYRFEQIDSGYRLTVTPVSSGSNETDPKRLAMMKRIEELTRLSYVLRLDETGSVQKLEDGDKYWSAILTALKDALSQIAETPGNAAGNEAIKDVIGLFERMPQEARLALLTEPVQPLVEFANSEMEIGEPISAQVEAASPFGGTVNRDVTVSLKKVADATAFLTISSTIPRAELDKLMQAFLKQMTALPADKRKEAAEAMASFERFRHDTRSDYEVSVDDGLLERFQSTEMIEVSDKAKQSRKVTTRSLARINE